MDIRCDCSACQTQFRTDAKYAGCKGKCPNCGAAVLVPASDTAASRPAAIPVARRVAKPPPSVSPERAEPDSAVAPSAFEGIDVASSGRTGATQSGGVGGVSQRRMTHRGKQAKRSSTLLVGAIVGTAALVLIAAMVGLLVFKGRTGAVADNNGQPPKEVAPASEPNQITQLQANAAGSGDAASDLADIESNDVTSATVESLAAFLKQDRTDRPPIAEQAFARVALTREDAEAAKRLLCEDHAAGIRAERAAEMNERRLRDGELVMPFYYQVFGEKPNTGRRLYISMHGGGGAPKAVNDQQWENQKGLYRPAEGVYLVPRAPTDAWNLWHQGHIDKMFDRLIENLIVFEGVDPNRVYLMGYSAGGDGVYQLAPRMADRLAAASMMAGHPNETSPLGLRNLPFAIFCGGRDSAYDRNKVAALWGDKLAELQKADPDGYCHRVTIYPDKGHWMDRQDAAALPWMAQYRRNLLPNRIVWKQDDVTHGRLYRLAVDAENRKARSEVVAELADQRISVTAPELDRLTVRLCDAMLDLDAPVEIVAGEQTVFSGNVQRTIGTLAKTLTERGDPSAVFTAELTVELPKP
jgi:dienelactone hydrolase